MSKNLSQTNYDTLAEKTTLEQKQRKTSKLTPLKIVIPKRKRKYR